MPGLATMVAMSTGGYRLRMSGLRRWSTVVLLGAIAAFMAPGVFVSDAPISWRLVAVAGVVTAFAGVRTLVGAVVVVRDEGVRLQRNWPLRRNIGWQSIRGVDVIPGYWTLELELDSGERVGLPCVEDFEDLYRAMEHHRPV